MEKQLFYLTAVQSVLFNIYSGSHDVSATGRFVQTLWFWFANRVEMRCFFFHHNPTIYHKSNCVSLGVNKRMDWQGLLK